MWHLFFEFAQHEHKTVMSTHLHLAVRGEIIKISCAGARQSGLLAQIARMPQRTSIISLSRVTRDAVQFVVEFCENLDRESRARMIEPLKHNSRALRDIVICADYFDIPELINLIASTVDPISEEFAPFA
jgi:hypothetical protein